MEKEIWKDIADYEGLYQVSNFGRVKSLAHIRLHWRHKTPSRYPDKILKGTPNNKECRNYKLYKGQLKKTFKGHTLVAVAFLKKPKYCVEVNHIDGSRLNNHVSNLEWVNKRENLSHRYIGTKRTSKLIGVCFRPDLKNQWVASYGIKNKTYYIGCFDSEKKANNAYIETLKAKGFINKYAQQKT